MKRFLLFTMLCVSFFILNAQTITWTGAGDGTNWSDLNNWDLLTVPTISNDVIIPEGDVLTGGNNVIINEHVYAKSIKVYSHNTLDVYNNITFRDNSFFEFFTTVNWYQGHLNSGETGPNAHISTITNKGTIYIRSSPASLGYCTLINEGGIGILSSGAIGLFTRSELKNQIYGIIDLHGESDILPMIPIPGYFSVGEIINYGTIERSSGAGVADISVPVNNYGTIEARLGDIRFINFDLINSSEGIIKGTKTIELPSTADFINHGIIEPGTFPGTLTLIGDFTSSSTSKLAVDLNGYSQGSDYDLLSIQGNAIFSGQVNITLGFGPSINDEFIVAKTTGSITQCNLESKAFAAYGGSIYEFNVVCQNNSEVRLKLINVEPGQTITWTGNGDGINWSNPNNWDFLAVPTKDNDVIIPDGSNVTINDNVQTKSFIVQGNTVMTLNDGISFTEPSMFEESVMVNWHFGSLSGEGSLTNKGTVNIDRPVPSFNSPGIIGQNFSFNNEGVINLINGNFQFQGGAVLNNQVSGIIELGEVEYGMTKGITGSGTLNNYGIIRKTQGIGVTQNSVEVNNYGVIEAMSGVIEFVANFNNTHDGVIKGTAAIDLSEISGYNNTGIFAPGASAGKLTLIGNFTSALGSILKIELNGLTQGLDYDHLATQGNAAFFTYIDIVMGFEGNINDEFIVATTTGTITACNLAPTASAEFNDNLYEFSVSCRNNNEVVLTLSNISLGIESNELTKKNIILFPNPVSDHFSIRNNSNQDLTSAIIIDLNGCVLEEIDLKGMQKDALISLQSYATGIYLIKIESETSSIVKRVVKI